MRKVISVALMAALACLVGFAQDAKAGMTIDLVWNCTNTAFLSGCGSNTIEVTSNAATLNVTLDIFLRSDETISIASIALEFDNDGGNELNALNVFAWGGFKITMGAFFNPLGSLGIITESASHGATGEIKSFSAAVSNPTVPAVAGTYHIGTAVFHLTANTTTDGADIISGIFAGVDFIANGTGQNVKFDTLFGTAAVNHIPEPGTAALLGLGLVGLILSGRRRSSRSS